MRDVQKGIRTTEERWQRVKQAAAIKGLSIAEFVDKAAEDTLADWIPEDLRGAYAAYHRTLMANLWREAALEKWFTWSLENPAKVQE